MGETIIPPNCFELISALGDPKDVCPLVYGRTVPGFNLQITNGNGSGSKILLDFLGQTKILKAQILDGARSHSQFINPNWCPVTTLARRISGSDNLHGSLIVPEEFCSPECRRFQKIQELIESPV